MSIACKLVDKNKLPREPGDMFYDINWLWVVLPNGHTFNLTLASKGFKHKHGIERWDVKGKSPKITVSPSIMMKKTGKFEAWHGFLTNGVLSDDLEGRIYL